MSDVPISPQGNAREAEIAEAVAHPEATGGPLGKKGLAWAIFEWARNPYYNVIVIALFTPYFAKYVVGGGQWGFTLASVTIMIAGIAAALTAPFLGVIADNTGRRKPVLVVTIVALCLLSAALWFALPGGGGLGIVGTMAVLATAYVCYTYSEVLHNAMLPDAGAPRSLPSISGNGLAFGAIASAIILIAHHFSFAAPAEPLFGIDKSMHEQTRIVGPIIAVWLAVFIVPFFLFMPDRPSKGKSWSHATADLFIGPGHEEGRPFQPFKRIGVLGGYLKRLFREDPNIMRFLVARTIYADAMTALLTLGSSYGATFIGYSAEELTIFGLITLLSAAIGGPLGGLLDRTLGPKRALFIELSVLLVLLTVSISIVPDSLLFGLVPGQENIWASPYFNSLSDIAYLLTFIPTATVIVATISTSRFMLVHLSPPDRIGEFFGLYAIAGTVTVWIGPALVGALTFISKSERTGMMSIGLLFLIGLVILRGVKGGKVPAGATKAAEASKS